MPAFENGWIALTETLKTLSTRLPSQTDPKGEADLYYRRACLAASEERWDVALVFCAKALDVAPRHLAARLLAARVHDLGLHNLEAAVAGYRKVIALAGYEGGNPYCVTAREALDALVARSAPPAAERPLV